LPPSGSTGDIQGTVAAAGGAPAPVPELSEARIKHLEMLQRTIERMARESATMKQYALASVAAIGSVTAATEAWGLALAGAVLMATFWYLDASYLAQERWFRTMYDEARAAGPDQPASFVMTPPEAIRERHTVAHTMQGWSTWPIYGALIVLLLLVGVVAD
jgi:hypothetical protein